MSASQLQEHIDAIKKDYMHSVNQLQMQTRELAKMQEELVALRHSNEQMNAMSQEIAKQMEIGRRLSGLINDFMPHLPAQHQMGLLNEVVALDKLRTAQVPSMHEQQQAIFAQMVMHQAAAAAQQQAQAAQLLGLGRGMMPTPPTSRGKANGMPAGMPQVSMPMAAFPGITMQAMMGMPQFAHPMMPGMPPIPGLMPGLPVAPPALNVQVSTPSRTHSAGSRTPLSAQPAPSPREPKVPISLPATLSAIPTTSASHLQTSTPTVNGSPVVSPPSDSAGPHSNEGINSLECGTEMQYKRFMQSMLSNSPKSSLLNVPDGPQALYGFTF